MKKYVQNRWITMLNKPSKDENKKIGFGLFVKFEIKLLMLKTPDTKEPI